MILHSTGNQLKVLMGCALEVGLFQLLLAVLRFLKCQKIKGIKIEELGFFLHI